MPKAGFFSHLGLFVIEGFFALEFCAQLRAEVLSSCGVPSSVERRGHYVLDQTVRRATGHVLAPPTIAEVSARIAAVRSDVERHFKTKLVDQEPPYFVTYKVGDYFRPHSDTGTAQDGPAQIKARKVAVVVFLNSQAEEPAPDSYCGGALTFYGLFEDPRWKPMGLPLRGETGLLVGFRADLVHEVTPVTYGERYTIVSRFS